MDVYKLYETLRNYLKENYSLDTNILLALIQDKKLPITAVLEDVPYIHSGFVSEITKTQGTADGNK